MSDAVTIRYFAWLREKIGLGEEIVTPPEGTRTVSNLIAWLATRGPEYADAFARPAVVRAAIDHTHVKADQQIAGAREIAFFPPVTGG